MYPPILAEPLRAQAAVLEEPQQAFALLRRIDPLGSPRTHLRRRLHLLHRLDIHRAVPLGVNCACVYLPALTRARQYPLRRFLSSPLDLDFALISKFGDAYKIDGNDLEPPYGDTVSAVLGKSHGSVGQYSEGQQKLFNSYHRIFKLGSKPAAHLSALATLDDFDLSLQMPDSITKLLARVKMMLSELPE